MKNPRVSPANIFAKECIVSALLKLIYRKPVSSISIKELCNTAGVSRMTFYRNYDSIEDIFQNHLSEIFETYRSESKLLENIGYYYDERHIRHYLDYLFNHREFLDGLVYCNFGSMFQDMLNEYIYNEWGQISDKYTLTAFSGALYNSFMLWSRNSYADEKSHFINMIVSIFGKQ